MNTIIAATKKLPVSIAAIRAMLVKTLTVIFSLNKSSKHSQNLHHPPKATAASASAAPKYGDKTSALSKK
jgi:hypothetical protein